MKKVSDAEKRDRSAAIVPGSESSAEVPSPAPAGPADGGLAGALASALAARKSKVSHSGKCSVPQFGSRPVTDLHVQMMKMTRMIGERQNRFMTVLLFRLHVWPDRQ